MKPGQQTNDGIATAFDLDEARLLNVIGVGPVLKDNLLRWRRSIESRFRFDPARSIPPAEIQSIVMKYVQLSQHHASTLENGFVRLRVISQESATAADAYETQLNKAIQNVAQANADLSIFA